jgi:hypothetical protein
MGAIISEGWERRKEAFQLTSFLARLVAHLLDSVSSEVGIICSLMTRHRI